MAQKTNAVGKGKGTVAPFIFLSDVLQDYGACKVSIDVNIELSQTSGGASDKNTTDFGDFLAAKIEGSEILLFDVHTLTVISGLEMREVLQYLRNRSSSEPTDIGMENGRDYYLDGERTMQAIAEINAPPPARRTLRRKTSQRNANSSVISPNGGPVRSSFEDEWGMERELISVDDMLLKLITARQTAKRRKDFPSVLAARAAAKKPASPLPVGATAMSTKPSDFYGYIYSASKFNRSGLPALSLDAAAPKALGGVQGLTERNAEWQRRLKDMYLADKEKSHVELCTELAKRLDAERSLRDTKVIKAKTISRLTRDPGGRKPGGRKPGGSKPKEPPSKKS